MNMKFSVAFVVTISAISSQAFGLPVYLKNLNDFYNENGIDVSPISNTYKCATCHNSASGGSRNDFGKDVGKSIKAGNGFSGMEFQDSDSDTYVNLEELFLGTAPALDTEKAVSRLEVKFDTLAGNGVFTVVGQGNKCTDMTIRSFGFKVNTPSNSTSFVDAGTFDASATATVALGMESKGSKGVILVKCGEEKKVGSFQVK